MTEVPSEIQAAWQRLEEAAQRIATEGPAAGRQALIDAVHGFRNAGDRSAESYALSLLGGVHNELGSFEQAAQFHLAGLEVARSLPKPGTRVVQHLDGLGISLGNMGRWREAEQYYEQALKETRKPIHAMRKIRSHVLRHLADLFARYSDRQREALELYDESIS
ncbi:MAG: tetratricopeptide repeat protein, partial [Blastocatellia bacterium]